MPNGRYFYDINSDYKNSGMRFNLKVEFNQSELPDAQFLESFRRKGIVLHDCGLCPIHLLNNNTEMREAATYCFLTQNKGFIENNENIPIISIFPSRRGWKKTQLPEEIRSRIVGEFSFNNVTGLKNQYQMIKEQTNDNIR